MSHYQTIKSLGTPIVVHSNLTRFLGSMTASALLSHIIYWSERTDNELGFYRTLKELMFETALTENELRGARKLLVNLGLVQETYKRLEHKLFFKFDSKAFDEWFDEQMAKCENHNCHLLNSQLPPVKTTDGEREIHSSLYTKITTKNTTKTTTEREYDTHTHENQTSENLQNSSQTKPTAKNSKSKKSKDYLTIDDLMNLKLSDFNFTDKDFKDYPNLGDWIFENMDYQIVKDYLAMRTNKLTMTAIKSSVKQASIAGLNLSQALEVCITSGKQGWQTFKADWYFNAQKAPAWQPPQNRMDELRRMANTNPTNVFVDDLPPEYYALGANHE